MKRTNLLLALSLIFAAAVFAAAKSESKTLTGYVIDNMCAGEHQPGADITDAAKEHTKDCALMPSCVTSGYALVVDGKLYKFDDKSNEKVQAIIKHTKTKEGLQLKVEGEVGDDGTIHATSIAEVN